MFHPLRTLSRTFRPQHRHISASAFRCRQVTFKNLEDFDVLVISGVPIVLNFHADWCEPCHILTPKLAELVGQTERVNLCTVSVEEFPELAKEFDVHAIPAVVALENGQVVDKFIGLIDVDRIESFVKRVDAGESEGESQSKDTTSTSTTTTTSTTTEKAR